MTNQKINKGKNYFLKLLTFKIYYKNEVKEEFLT